MDVVELETSGFAASVATRVYKGAPSAVAFPDGAAGLARHIPAAPARRRVGLLGIRAALARVRFRFGRLRIRIALARRFGPGAGFLFLELGHQGAHGAEVDFFDRATGRA
jgi:hypothetical protein